MPAHFTFVEVSVVGGLAILGGLLILVAYLERKHERRAHEQMLRELRMRSVVEGYAKRRVGR